MRIFVTGADGYIGSVVTRKLVEAGHEVLGLSRSEESAKRLQEMRASVHKGDLADPESLASGASSTDGVIHLAMHHNPSNLDESFAIDRVAAEAMLFALKGTNKPFVYTSGAAVLSETGEAVVDESFPPDMSGPIAKRAQQEMDVLAASKDGIRTIAIRPGLVYGRGGSGIVHMLAGLVRQAGGAHTIGSGDNVWSAIHVDDLAALFVSALESAPAGALYNAASEEIPSMLEVTSAIARNLKLEQAHRVWPVDEARDALGPYADNLASNKRISSAKARRELSWAPRQLSLIEDIEHGSYAGAFEVASK